MLDGSWHTDANGTGRWSNGTCRVLITGIEGMIGGNLAYWYSRRASVFGLCDRHSVALPHCEILRWKDASPGTLAGLIREVKPDRILHCGPLARGSWDLVEASDEHSLADFRHERAVCRALIEGAKRCDAHLTVLLTDAVFAGPRLFHEEQEPIVNRHPAARAAKTIQRALDSSGALTVRTHAYGWSPCTHEPTFAERVWLAVTEGLPCVFDPQAFATPILAADLAKLVWLAQERGLSGLYHIAGAERTSAYRFASELASLAGLPLPNAAAHSDSHAAPPSRARETSLNSRRIHRALACPLPMLREGLAGLLAQLRDGTREGLQGRMQSEVQMEAA